jgi:hypothetical protein
MTRRWPSIPLDAWRPTRETLHRYSQILGKIQLALTPLINHYWNVALRVTARGVATTTLPYGDRAFDIELDLVTHRVIVRTSSGDVEARELRPLSVAGFERELFEMLEALSIDVRIWDHPVELRSEPIPFSQDTLHAAYDREYVERFFRVLRDANAVLEEFRAGFAGKCSGVGFYWGTFDLAVARYSGRRAPDAPTANAIDREAYSHELSEVGFWPGDAVYTAPAFYALQYPAPDGYTRAAVRPTVAYWYEPSRCFVLPYEEIREREPAAQILEFCQSTYEAGATLAGWNRAELEHAPPPGGRHAA